VSKGPRIYSFRHFVIKYDRMISIFDCNFNLRRYNKGLVHLPGTKEAIAEQLRIGQELRRKIGVGGGKGEAGGDSDEVGRCRLNR